MAFATKHSLLLLVTLALATAATDSDSTFSRVKEISNIITNEVTYVPPMIVLGKTDGDIVRCPFTTPNSCETYHTGQSPVTATIVHGEYLFAALKSGCMLRCMWHRRQSCQVFYHAASEMTGLAVLGGNIYVGILDGSILKCNMNTPESCQLFANIGNKVKSLAASGTFIFAGSGLARIYRCDIFGNCSIEQLPNIFDKYPRIYDVTGLAVVGSKVFGLTYGGYIQFGDETSSSFELIAIAGATYTSMGVYDGKLYPLKDDEILIHAPGSDTTTLLATQSGAVSISIAYGTYAMQEKYRIESVKCIWNGVFKCPPTVFYYDDLQRRSSLEVFVKDGKLYDSQGVLVDTSNADESYSQRAAIFAMGPDGQILLSNVHKQGLLHTSSLFAGSPVSGAGLMVVEQGKIANITACSVHYRPDQDLNSQVKQALRTKGYTDNIDLHPCSYNDMLCVLDGTSGQKF